MDWTTHLNYSMADYIRERGEPNDPDLDDEKILLFLAQGRRIPQNDYERKVLEQIEEGRRAGMGIDIPANGL